jgi:putative FmdB family regulatory protein
MPLREYTCDACGWSYELLERMDDPPPDTCPACGSQSVRRLPPACSFKLKGTGWTPNATKARQKGKEW